MLISKRVTTVLALLISIALLSGSAQAQSANQNSSTDVPYPLDLRFEWGTKIEPRARYIEFTTVKKVEYCFDVGCLVTITGTGAAFAEAPSPGSKQVAVYKGTFSVEIDFYEILRAREQQQQDDTILMRSSIYESPEKQVEACVRLASDALAGNVFGTNRTFPAPKFQLHADVYGPGRLRGYPPTFFAGELSGCALAR